MKSPKVYVRDTGIVHALLGIRDKEALLAHPVVGQTWESFVIETLITRPQTGRKRIITAPQLGPRWTFSLRCLMANFGLWR